MVEAPIRLLTGAAQLQPLVTSATPHDPEQLPSNLAGLPSGSFLSGFVINRDRQNNPILRTDHGDVLVKSDVFLKTGSEVVIRIENTAAQARARIIRVDDKTIQELIDLQQKNTPVQDDEVLRPSIAQPVSRAIAENSDEALGLKQDTILLKAVLLKATDAPGQRPETLLTNVLRLPTDLARQVIEGQSLMLRVVSSELKIAPSAAPGTQAAAPMLMPQQPPSALATMQHYQAYSQKAVPLPPTMPAPSAPPAAAVPLTTAPAASPPPAPLPIIPTASTPIASGASAAATPAPTAPQMPTVATPAAATPTTLTTPLPTAAAAPSLPLPVAPAPANAATPAAVQSSIPTVASTPTPLPDAASAAPAPQTPTPLTAALPHTQPVAHSIEAAAQQPTRPGVMTATVIGHEPSGETVVRTPIGTVKLITATPPPIGSTLQLEWASSAPPFPSSPLPVAPGSASATPVTLAAIGHHWEAMHQAFQALAAQPALQAELAARIPNTKSKLVNEVLFFVSALKSGDIRQWLGNRVADALEDKQPGLLQRLGQEMGALRTLNADVPENGWQIHSFPLMHEDALHQARLYVRRDTPKDPAGTGKGGGTRFLVECTFTQLGQMQLDGLVRGAAPALHFDLMVRSERPLIPQMQADISSLFKQGGQAAGYAGDVRFQDGIDYFVRPLHDNATAAGSDSGQSILA